VGAAAATLAGPGVAAAASLVRAAADVALSELPAKECPEVLRRQGYSQVCASGSPTKDCGYFKKAGVRRGSSGQGPEAQNSKVVD
jgi:hypothetical protein